MLSHVIGYFGPIVVPLVIYLWQREKSRFVAFHALQVVFWHLLLTVIAFMIPGVLILCIALGLATGGLMAVVSFPLIVMGILLGAALNAIFTIWVAIKANNGEWAALPVVGGFALRSSMI